MLFFRRKKYSQLSDEKLWSLYVEGDAKALEEVFTRHTEKLILFAFSLVKNKEEAKDIVYYQFEKLFKLSLPAREMRYGELRKGVEPIFYAMVKNGCYDHIEKFKRRREINENIAKTKSTVSSENGEQVLFKEEIFNQISKLPSRQQEFIIMYMRGYKVSEIAEEKNLAVSSVKNTINSAKKALKLNLTDYD